jgi:hypothetical protein
MSLPPTIRVLLTDLIASLIGLRVAHAAAQIAPFVVRRSIFSAALARLIANQLWCPASKSGRWRSGQSREVVMLTRRGFAGFASCAICGLTGFVATDASAQGATTATTPGVTRKLLSQMDGPGDGFQVPPETPHAGSKNGDKKTRIAVTYVVEKGKPLASPA